MKKTIKQLIFFLLILNTYSIQAQELYGKTFFSPRSIISNGARRLSGKTGFINRKENSEKCSGFFSITPEYSHSFKTRRVAEHFFATDTIHFSGSQVATRSENDILADYFGMSPTFNSELILDPKLKMFLVDFQFYCGLDYIYPGLYVRANAPAAWVQSEIELDENIVDDGSLTQFPALYMSAGALTAPVTSAKKPFEGDTTFGHVSEGIKYGKINGKKSEKGIADIYFALGYNFIRRERGHLGLNLFFVAPTGTQPNSQYLFEPIVGNGKHWEFGVGFTGDLLLWEKGGDQTVRFNVDCNFSHMFKSRQCRSFDFKSNGFGSRFILLKQFDNAATYNGTVVPAINKTTLACDVSVGFQADIVLMATYEYDNWNFDLGYNGWVRSSENVCIIGNIEKNRYGFKGIQNVSGIDENKTQSSATLNGNELTPAIQAAVADTVYPRFISTSDLDPSSAEMPRSITHKIFTNLNYQWKNHNNQKTIPFLGIGAEIEFEGIRNETEPNKNTLSMIGIWIQGGLAY